MSAISPKIKAYLSLATICFVWGGTFLAVSVGIESLPPLFLSGFRQIISGALLIVYCRWMQGDKMQKGEWKNILVSGGCIVLFSNTLIIWSLKVLPSGLATLLMTSIPIWVTILNLLIKGKLPGIYPAAGLLTGFIGIIIIFNDNTSSLLNSDYALSIGALLTGTLFWALGSFLMGDTSFKTKPFLIAGIQLFIFAIPLLAASYAFENWQGIRFPASAWGSLFYLIVFDQMIAYAAYIYALRELPVTLVSVFVYVNPIVALFLGWLIRNESFSMQMAVAAVIIFTSVYLLNKKPS